MGKSKPFIGEIEIDKYLATGQIEAVLAGGENYLGSRPLHYEWVKQVYDACVKYKVHLIFGQTGNVFIKDGIEQKIRNRTEQMVQALRSGLHYPPKDVEKEIAAIYARKEAIAAAELYDYTVLRPFPCPVSRSTSSKIVPGLAVHFLYRQYL